MKSLVAKLSIAAFGLSLAAVPLSASAAQVGIGVSGPGYSVHAGYVNPGGPCYGCGRGHAWGPPPPNYGWHPAGWRPAPPAVLYEGYYGWAPGGFYGYYSHGVWYAHRRWGNGFWLYF
jgi:hypothetical protein